MQSFAITRTAVLLIWVILTGVAGAFVARYGHNLPVNDEWAFVPVLFAGRATKLDWLTEKHLEHRYPLARAVYLALHEGTGHDFRAGMWLTVALLSGSALLLIEAARRLRGQPALLDAAFPVLLLHPGHAENLLMGYQIAFTLTVFALAVFLWLTTANPNQPGRTAAVALLPLAACTLGGGAGLVFTPFLGGWIAYQAGRMARSSGLRGKLAAGALLLAVLAAMGYLAWSAAGVAQANPTAVRNGSLETLLHASEVLTLGLGPAVMSDPPVGGWVLFALELGAAGWLLRQIVRHPAERAAALGLLAVLVGVWGFALAIGHTRANGWPPRFAVVSALGPAVVLLTFARSGSVVGGRYLGLIALAAGVVLVLENRQAGKRYARPYDQRFQAVRADVRAGVPIEVLAERHTYYWHPDTAANWLLLGREGLPLLRGVPTLPPYRIVTILPPERGTPLPLELVWPRQPILAVRVRFRCAESRYLQRFVFRWTADDGERTSAINPWVMAGPGVTAFWIDAPLAGGRLEGDPAEGVEILQVELFVPR